jgi:hypothetical protein
MAAGDIAGDSILSLPRHIEVDQQPDAAIAQLVRLFGNSVTHRGYVASPEVDSN